MEVSPDTLRTALTALVEAQRYVLHPASVTPSISKRVATHRVSAAEFHALTGQLRSASKALAEVLQRT